MSFIQLSVIVVLYYIHFLNVGHILALPESKLSDFNFNSRELASLAAKWNLTSNGGDLDIMTFRLDYIVSDFILDNMMTATAYTTECKEGGYLVPDSDMKFEIVMDDVPPGAGDSERNISVNITVDPSIEDSIIFTTVDDENGMSAEVDFCLRLSLYTDGSTPIEVNFLETIVGLRVNLSSGFSIDAFQVAPKEVLLVTASEEFEAVGYKCDRNNDPLTGEALTKAMNQGEVIRVCVTPNQEARNQGVYMRAIESFTYFRDYGGPLGLVTQVAVEDSKAASNYLTVLDCTPGMLVCTFETILFASMFMSPGFVDGSGTAILQFGSDANIWRQRNLESQSSYRSLQEGDGETVVSKFDLDFEIIQGEKFNGVLKKSSSLDTKTFTHIITGTMFWLSLMLLR